MQIKKLSSDMLLSISQYLLLNLCFLSRIFQSQMPETRQSMQVGKAYTHYNRLKSQLLK